MESIRPAPCAELTSGIFKEDKQDEIKTNLGKLKEMSSEKKGRIRETVTKAMAFLTKGITNKLASKYESNQQKWNIWLKSTNGTQAEGDKINHTLSRLEKIPFVKAQFLKNKAMAEVNSLKTDLESVQQAIKQSKNIMDANMKSSGLNALGIEVANLRSEMQILHQQIDNMVRQSYYPEQEGGARIETVDDMKSRLIEGNTKLERIDAEYKDRRAQVQKETFRNLDEQLKAVKLKIGDFVDTLRVTPLEKECNALTSQLDRAEKELRESKQGSGVVKENTEEEKAAMEKLLSQSFYGPMPTGEDEQDLGVEGGQQSLSVEERLSVLDKLIAEKEQKLNQRALEGAHSDDILVMHDEIEDLQQQRARLRRQ